MLLNCNFEMACERRARGSLTHHLELLKRRSLHNTMMIQIDLQPHLVGDLIELRPMRPEDWEDLYAVAADPLIWEVHPARDRYKEERFREYFQEALQSRGALVAVERKTAKIIGASRYYWYGPDQSELEIGWTFLARSHWGGVYNGEMKRLMLRHAFRFVEHVVFLVDPVNRRSQLAMERIGGVRTGTRIDYKGEEKIVYEITREAPESDDHGPRS